MSISLQAQRCEGFEVSRLPQGQITRLLVELTHNGLGQSVRVPVMVARGALPGKVFGITAALHGNELNGIPVIHRLLDTLDLKKLRGAVVGVPAVNIPGLLAHERYFSDGEDLNHVMPGKENGNESQSFAHRFLERVVRHFDYLIDLHTASFGRVNSFYVRADLHQNETMAMAILQRPQIILHNPPSDHTLRGAVQAMGIPAITIELRDPQRFQADVVQRSAQGIRAVLSHFGFLPKRKYKIGPRPIICESSEWMYTDSGGLLRVFPDVADGVRADDVVARLSSIFGDVITEYAVPTDGVVIGRSSNPVGQTGARIIHLGCVTRNMSNYDLGAFEFDGALDENLDFT